MVRWGYWSNTEYIAIMYTLFGWIIQAITSYIIVWINKRLILIYISIECFLCQF